MSIESIRLKNFKALRDVYMKDIPPFCVVVGANGTGKSTLFQVFGFLRDCLTGDVNTALTRLGGRRGFREVRSRDAEGPIVIELKYRVRPDAPLMAYALRIGEDKDRACIERETLRRCGGGKPRLLLDFSRGGGMAVAVEPGAPADTGPRREEQKLKSADISAIKALAQFERFPEVVALGDLLENGRFFDFHIDRARADQEAGHAEHLSREGENLALVIDYLRKHHPKVFAQILERLRLCIPDIAQVEPITTEYGRVLLQFRDSSFTDSFSARHVSDGTLKMLAYLTLLYDPAPHPLLCVEEPENQLYPSLLWELAEEFRAYADRGGQVFVSTHSPDFLNAAKLEEVFWLVKKGGYTSVMRAGDDEQLAAYMAEGDQMGYLWSHGLFPGVNP